MNVHRYATVEAALGRLRGVCGMEKSEGQAPCGRPREILRMLDTADRQLIILELCREHDESLMAMIAATIPITYRADEQAFTTVDDLKTYISTARALDAAEPTTGN